MSVDREKLEQVFVAALSISDAVQRQQFVQDACGRDAALFEEIQSLLTAHDEASVDLPTRLVSDSLRRSLPDSQGSEQSGCLIGRYKLLERIGEGGFGVVWMAEQEEPVRRRVALKVIKLGMDTREVVARFEAERQALAMMDHPNIARVFDGGATENGRPYFVMELVRGEPITQYCDERHLCLEERLALFTQVCYAVQHAHQKGIIHRDLKPSNVLTAMHDDKPVPKVIDFGIAKATQQPLTERTLFTRFHQFVGTPAYMSPEQAGASSLDVDTRSDVYSLGVLLYELLTGRTPFLKEELQKVAYDEICRVIREQEPPKPSTRLSTFTKAEQSTVAARRKIPLEKLTRLIRGELDWVVMKALEKDRTRRYESATALSQDVERFLRREPVLAAPPSRLYRFRKLVRRNRLAFTAAGAIGVVLVMGLCTTSWALFRERAAHRRAVDAQQAELQARQQAQDNEKKAHTEASKSRQVAGFLKEMLSAAKPSVARGRDTTLLREVLNRASERVGPGLAGEPEVEAELRDILGQVYSDLSLFGEAELMFRRSLELRGQLRGGEHREMAEALDNWGNVLRALGHLEGAEFVLGDAVNMARRVVGEDQLLAELLNDLGIVFLARQKYAEAETAGRESVALYRKLTSDPTEEMAGALHCLAVTIWEDKRPAEAEVLQCEAHEILRRLKGDTSVEVAHSLNNLAAMASSQGRISEAERLNRQALALRSELLPHYHWEVAQSHLNLAVNLFNRGAFKDAEPLMREAVDIQRHLSDPGGLVWSLNWLGILLTREDQLEEAERLLRESLAVAREVLGFEHEHTTSAISNLSATLEKAERWSDAEDLHREIVASCRRSLGSGHPATAKQLGNLAELLARHRKLEEAADSYREAFLIYEQALGPAAPQAAEPLHQLGHVLAESGKLAEAAATFHRTIQILQMRPGHPAVPHITDQLTRLLVRLGRQTEAEAVAREALDDAGNFPDGDVTRAALRLARVLGEQDRPSDQDTVDFAQLDRRLGDLLDVAGSTPAQQAGFLVARGQLRAMRGLWTQAADDFQKAIALKPDNELLRFFLGPLLVQGRDAVAYETLRAGSLARFAGVGDPFAAVRLAKSCLLLPWSGRGLEIARNWAETGLQIERGNRSWPSALVARALAAYRLEDFDTAAQWAQKVLSDVAADEHGQVQASAVLAMAQQRLSRADEARAALTQSERIASAMLVPMDGAHFGDQWVNWIIAQVLLSEATTVVGSSTVATLVGAASVPKRSLTVGAQAPPLRTGRWLQGEPVHAFEAGKAYLIEFWSTWCPPCRVVIPHLNAIHLKYKDRNLVVIGQNCWENDETKVEPFVNKWRDRMSYRVALDDKSQQKTQGAMTETWMTASGQQSIPMAFLVDQQGRVAWIGHPTGLRDEIIDSVLNGTYNLAAAAADFLEERRNDENMAAAGSAVRRVHEAIQVKDWHAALASLAEAEPLLTPGNHATLRLQLLLARRDYSAALELAEKLFREPTRSRIPLSTALGVLNAQAWSIATRSSASEAALACAERFAQLGVELSHRQDANIIDTLARVVFRRGRREEAVALQELAVKLAYDAPDFQKTLESYRQGKLPDP